VSEDRIAPNGRVLRIEANGTHRALLANFSSPQGLIFDPATGDLLVAEQDLSRIWRVRFATSLPALPVGILPALLLALGSLGSWRMARVQRNAGIASRGRRAEFRGSSRTPSAIPHRVER
jgi:hypothetical protein